MTKKLGDCPKAFGNNDIDCPRAFGNNDIDCPRALGIMMLTALEAFGNEVFITVVCYTSYG